MNTHPFPLFDYLTNSLSHSYESVASVAPGLLETIHSLRNIINALEQFVYVIDSKGTILFANSALASAYDVPLSELIGRPFEDCHTVSEEAVAYKAAIDIVCSGDSAKFSPEEVFTDYKGNRRLVQTTRIPFDLSGDNSKAILCISLDITENVITTDELLEANEYLTCAARLAKVGVWEYVIAERKFHWSNDLLLLLGLEAFAIPEKLNVRHHSFATPPFAHQLEKYFVLATQGIPYRNFRYQLIKPTGAIIQVIESVEIFRDYNNTPCKIVGVVQDITSLMNELQPILTANSVNNSLPYLVAQLDLEYYFNYINKRFKDAFALEDHANVGLRICDIFSNDVYCNQILPALQECSIGKEICLYDVIRDEGIDIMFKKLSFTPIYKQNKVVNLLVTGEIDNPVLQKK